MNIKNLSIRKIDNNSLIVVTLEPPSEKDQDLDFRKLCVEISNYLKKCCADLGVYNAGIIVMSSTMKIEVLDETIMNHLGWFRHPSCSLVN